MAKAKKVTKKATNPEVVGGGVQKAKDTLGTAPKTVFRRKPIAAPTLSERAMEVASSYRREIAATAALTGFAVMTSGASAAPLLAKFVVHGAVSTGAVAGVKAAYRFVAPAASAAAMDVDGASAASAARPE